MLKLVRTIDSPGRYSLSSGTRQPAFNGISISSIERMQYITAEWTTEIGAFRFPRTSQPVPSKSKIAEPSDSFISTRRDIYIKGQLVQASIRNDGCTHW